MAKVKPKATIKIKTYHIISEAVDAGIGYGWNRAHKHTDNPDENYIKERIYDAIMSGLCDIIDFDDGLDD